MYIVGEYYVLSSIHPVIFRWEHERKASEYEDMNLTLRGSGNLFKYIAGRDVYFVQQDFLEYLYNDTQFSYLLNTHGVDIREFLIRRSKYDRMDIFQALSDLSVEQLRPIMDVDLPVEEEVDIVLRLINAKRDTKRSMYAT